jgi:hypothetical protein
VQLLRTWSGMVGTPHSSSSCLRRARYSAGCSTAKQRSSSSDWRERGGGRKGRVLNRAWVPGRVPGSQLLSDQHPSTDTHTAARLYHHHHSHPQHPASTRPSHLQGKHAKPFCQRAPHPPCFTGHCLLLLRREGVAAEVDRGREGCKACRAADQAVSNALRGHCGGTAAAA